MIDTKYILEYRYEDEAWIVESEFNRACDAHFAFSDHVKTYSHTIARVRKVRYVEEESVVATFQPISSEEYEDE
jgi:hypothetical protein